MSTRTLEVKERKAFQPFEGPDVKVYGRPLAECFSERSVTP